MLSGGGVKKKKTVLSHKYLDISERLIAYMSRSLLSAEKKGEFGNSENMKIWKYFGNTFMAVVLQS